MNRTALQPADIEALADSLSDSADALHKRIMRAIGQNADGRDAAITHAEAQALFDQEVALRQHANKLYTEAVRYAAGSVALPARELLDLTALARDRIRHIDRVKDVAGIAATLLTAAAAVAAQHPERLPAALKDLKAHLASLRASKEG
ncbi:hypothetical protein IP91_01206 [Pseudoduganella lurida]|uniref:Uncharacterized protein n=1 Tax=Pseudoduganella lurida TaxID=1036180 RepID=A0A562RP28_9BURK|nr:hypothetical protein [Pseudoduganella lurida]TWI70126.1 hypothetical protein IP91_01206 [Pseudoduganella lurida]